MEEIIQLPLTKEQFFLLMATLGYACALESDMPELLDLSLKILDHNFRRAEGQILPLSTKFGLLAKAIDPTCKSIDDIIKEGRGL